MKTSEEKLLAGLAHLGIFLHLAGIVIALVIYLLQKDKSHFTAEHAKQALGYQIAVTIFSSLLGFVGMGGFFGGMMLGGHRFGIPSAGIIGLLFGLITLGLVGYAAYGAYKGFVGQEFEYAVIGEFIKRI